MLLAEALLLRADLQKRQALLRKRIKRSLVVQEGDRPAEDPSKLLARLQAESEELSRLVAAINHANEAHKITCSQGEVTLTQALAHREHLQNMAGALRELAESSNPSTQYSRSEIRSVPVMDAAKLQSQADNYARDLRKLILTLQKADWNVTVEDYEPSELVADAVTTTTP